MRALRVLAHGNYLVALLTGMIALYLLTMPLHPATGDAHAGLLAAFSGLFLLPLPLAAFVTGRLIRRKSRAAWPMQCIVVGLLVALAVLLAS